MAVETLRPNTAGDECNLDFQAGATCPNHYQNVDEEVSDESTTYVGASSPADSWLRDLYNIANSGIGSGAINFVKVYAVMSQNSGTVPHKAKIVIKSGTTISETTEINPTIAWTTYSQQWNTDPDTSSPWTWAAIDALQVGVSLWKDDGFGGVPKSTQIYVEVDYEPSVAAAGGSPLAQLIQAGLV